LLELLDATTAIPEPGAALTTGAFLTTLLLKRSYGRR